MHSQSDSALQKLNSMDKMQFLRVMCILKKLRMEYELDCVFHWHYKLHYSTKWMGVDKSKIIVLDLKQYHMPGMGSSSDEEKLEVLRLPRFSTKSWRVPQLTLSGIIINKMKNNFKMFKLIKNTNGKFK